ncbi:MAG: GAF domain-containing protein [Anaerolineae bacterium]
MREESARLSRGGCAMRPPLRNLTTRAILLLSLCLVIGLCVVSAGVYVGLRNSRRESLLEELTLTASNKTGELSRWVQMQRYQLSSLATSSVVRAWAEVLSTKDESQPGYREAYASLSALYVNAVREQPGLRTLSLLRSPDGRVVISTDPTREGEYQGTDAYFVQGLKGAYLSPAVVSPGTGRTLLFISVPVDGEDGTVAVTVAELDLDWMQRNMLGRASFGTGWERYLVDRSFRLITGPGVSTTLRPKLWSGAVGMLREDVLGNGIYENGQGELVLGAYSWVEDLDVALLLEVRHAPAVGQPLLHTMFRLAAVMLGVIVLFVLGARFIARRSLGLLKVMRDYVQCVADGDLTQSVPVSGEDEFGELAVALNRMVDRMRSTYAGLEARVEARTDALRRRSLQLQAAARVSGAVAVIRDVDELLAEMVRLIPEYFDYDHVGIFLLDDARRHAVLRAASSEGGQRMLARGHKLAVGQGIVGSVAQSGQPRIALDVGDDPVFFDNPDLPRTRSEMALPLMMQERLIGVLDVQTEMPAAFSEEDIAVLRSMADQVALAIENARLLEASDRMLRELRLRYGQQIQESWSERLSARDLAFRYTGADVRRVQELSGALPERPAIAELDGGARELRAPIRVRDVVIGSVVFRQEAHQEPWGEGEVAFVGAICTQIGQALEQARLLDEAQVRASFEQLTGEISERIRSSATDVDGVMATTLRELSLALGATGTIEVQGVRKWHRVGGNGDDDAF